MIGNRRLLRMNRGSIRDERIKKRAEDIKRGIESSSLTELDALCEEVALIQLHNEELSALIQAYQEVLSLRDENLPFFHEGEHVLYNKESVVIDACFPLSKESGFHGAECGDEGLIYRWTGPVNYFFFDIFVARAKPLEGELWLTSSVIPENLDSIQCYVDGVSVPLEKGSALQMKYFFRVEPRELPGSTNVTFFVKKTVSPAAIKPESTDQRLLGVAFHRLQLTVLEE